MPPVPSTTEQPGRTPAPCAGRGLQPRAEGAGAECRIPRPGWEGPGARVRSGLAGPRPGRVDPVSRQNTALWPSSEQTLRRGGSLRSARLSKRRDRGTRRALGGEARCVSAQVTAGAAWCVPSVSPALSPAGARSQAVDSAAPARPRRRASAGCWSLARSSRPRGDVPALSHSGRRWEEEGVRRRCGVGGPACSRRAGPERGDPDGLGPRPRFAG